MQHMCAKCRSPDEAKIRMTATGIWLASFQYDVSRYLLVTFVTDTNDECIVGGFLKAVLMLPVAQILIHGIALGTVIYCG
jgi:hypothetical protein